MIAATRDTTTRRILAVRKEVIIIEFDLDDAGWTRNEFQRALQRQRLIEFTRRLLQVLRVGIRKV